MNGLFARVRLQETLLVVSILVVLLAFLQVACGGSVDTGRKEISESIAKYALRQYGDTQYAYSNYYYRENKNRIRVSVEAYNDYFASWDELKRAKFISEGVTKENLINDYTLVTSVNSFSVYWYQGQFKDPPQSTFTAVAIPNYATPVDYLSTFSIREDLVIRRYDPKMEGQLAYGENDDYGTRTWTPVED